jgi:aldehyde:ferredoxin oxidoreductase
MQGFSETLLRANLTQGTFTADDVDNNLAKDSIGGRCLVSKLLFDEKDEVMRQLNLSAGLGYTEGTVMLAVERISNLERLFNLRAGFASRDDTLPKRIPQRPMRGVAARGQVVSLPKMLSEYCQVRGWDENGVPTPEKLTQLGLT